MREVERITVPGRRYTRRGLLIGMVPGLLVPAGAVRARARDDAERPTAGPLGLALNLGPGLAVTLVGGGVGAWVGHSIVYRTPLDATSAPPTEALAGFAAVSVALGVRKRYHIHSKRDMIYISLSATCPARSP